MSIKVELGNKIRRLREEQGLSRGELCEGEEELTVRQLARIEAGESLPTLPKLEFIAGRLSVSVSLLVDRKYVKLPKRYLQLKQRIYKFYTHRDEKRVAEKEKLFERIYSEYYELLPEEEQLAVDVQYSSMNVFLVEKANFGEGLLSEYFYKVIQNREFTINDLLIIELYFQCIHFNGYDEKLFLSLFNRVVGQIDHSLETERILLSKILVVATSVFIEFDNYHKIIESVNAIHLIMETSQDFQQKPGIDLFEGKYWLFSQKEKNKAEQKYTEGAKFAEMMGNSLLSDKILKEWEEDLAIFEQQQSST